ncbi:MAG: PadR family transcriptional regulator [Parvibaculum sp.]
MFGNWSDHRRHHHHPKGPRGRHRSGFGRRGGRRRAFEQGDLRLVILKLIADEPRHGYDVIKAIEETFGGTYRPSPGIIYPTLTMLEDLGFATVTPEGSKKLYTATEEGLAFLETNKATVEMLFARMNEARRAWGGELAPEIKRALENFRAAFELRLERGEIDTKAVSTIAKAIDDAAASVEKA